MKRLECVILVKLALWIALGICSILASKAHAQGSFLDISVDGSYSKSKDKFSTNYRKTWGLQLGIPLTSFFEVALGHTFTENTVIYNDLYRKAMISSGYTIPEGSLSAKTQVQDYSANGALGYSIGAVKPSIFGGALRRKMCREDVLADDGCETQDLTWNAGVSLQIYLTMALRLKATYRISPSIDQSTPKKSYDELTSLGLTWSL